MREVNFDGLVGPTHYFGGLSYGNLASMEHAKRPSNPKKAALQGLKKMKRLADLGIPQAVLPPQERPSLPYLHALGFRGKDHEILAQTPPDLLALLCSSSAMWRANSATVTPSSDSFDGHVHLTIANLQTTLHRTLEVEETEKLFRRLFSDSERFTIHSPLPFADEGAANHIRFTSSYDQPGTHLYVYGRSLFEKQTTRFPARQTKEACEAIARTHGTQAVFARQNPALIEKGVFHNDVIACGNRSTLLYHPEAFEETERVLAEIERTCPLQKIPVEIPIEQAIETYLFNSQLLTLPDQTHLLLAPSECRQLALDWLPFPVEFVDLKESMLNGGGPACLRLAIPLTEEEIQKVPPQICLDEELYQNLTAWVSAYYRDRLTPADFADPAFLTEVQTALDALTQILNLGSHYSFQ
ncbi:MAG: N-succinylarginine dihydrolase [Chlamydiales bacterium]|nr:N-succinylarginine dihydrolase [Chlamydiales bacterium]